LFLPVRDSWSLAGFFLIQKTWGKPLGERLSFPAKVFPRRGGKLGKWKAYIPWGFHDVFHAKTVGKLGKSCLTQLKPLIDAPSIFPLESFGKLGKLFLMSIFQEAFWKAGKVVLCR